MEEYGCEMRVASHEKFWKIGVSRITSLYFVKKQVENISQVL